MEPKCVWIGFADVRKAYDNVDLDHLDKMIRYECQDEFVLQQWEDQYLDMIALNMDVDGYLIKRTKGLPQGSELAPVLFNFYTTTILKDLKLADDVDYGIFADNWVFTANSEKSLREAMISTNIVLKTYGLEFELSEAFILWTNGTLFDAQEFTQEEDALAKTYKFLGIPWNCSNGKVLFNWDDVKFKLTKWMIKPGYETVKMVKKFIIPKFRYYWTYLKKISKSNAKEYLSWFKKVLRKWLQHQLIYQNVSEDFMIALIFPRKNEYLCAIDLLINDTELETRNLSENQIKLIKRLKELGNIVVKQHKKIGIYQASNLLFNDSNIEDELKRNEIVYGKPFKRSKMVMDILMKSIYGENRISTAIFRDQMNFAKKTRRKKIYTIFG
jgi:hypothetical protein